MKTANNNTAAAPCKLTAAEVAAAVAVYNAKNAAVLDYLHTAENGMVYRRTVQEIPAALCVQSADSQTGEKVIRLKAEKVHRFVMESPEFVCAVAELDNIRAEFPAVKNYGDAIEYFYRRTYENATTWRKDSTPFYVAGDIVINGAQVQIKFGGARLAAYRLLTE